MGEFLLHHMLQGAPAWDLLGSISSMVTSALLIEVRSELLTGRV
jgi:hypothetical protein